MPDPDAMAADDVVASPLYSVAPIVAVAQIAAGDPIAQPLYSTGVIGTGA